MSSPEAPRSSFTPINDHGTNMASIIAPDLKGDVCIISLRVDHVDSCRDADPCQIDKQALPAAVRKAEELGVDIVNFSFAGAPDQALLDAVHSAAGKGIRFSFANGNDRYESPNAPLAEAVGKNSWIVTPKEGRKPELLLFGKPKRTYQRVWLTDLGRKVQKADGKWSGRSGSSVIAAVWSAKLNKQKIAGS